MLLNNPQAGGVRTHGIRPFPAFLSIAYVMTGSAKVAKALLEKYGRTFSDELDIKLESNTPSALFRGSAPRYFSAPVSATKLPESSRGVDQRRLDERTKD